MEEVGHKVEVFGRARKLLLELALRLMSAPYYLTGMEKPIHETSHGVR